MKDRIKALDGLRGFAALSVFLSHSVFKAELVLPPLLAKIFYRTFQVGPNSVQIFFVLCGFLMAFFYPKVDKMSSFLQKRYTRIFPIYIVVCIFLFLLRTSNYKQMYLPKLLDIFLVILVALGFSYGWRFLRRSKFMPIIAKILFWSFIGLQLVFILINSLLVNHLVLKNQLKEVYVLMTNITMTTPFIKHILLLNAAFWSLAPEILFYVVYPFIVIPLINICKKGNIWIKLLIIGGAIKVIFDLDKISFAFSNSHSLYFGRMIGFVVGVIIGSIMVQKNKLWKKLISLFSKSIVNILVLLAFIAVQWGDDVIRNGSSYQITNLYYCVSSLIIGTVIISVQATHSWINKIFSNKFLIFLGIISYSLYLIHLPLIQILSPLIEPLNLIINNQSLFEIIRLIIVSIITITIASILYNLVEKLYFTGKKTAIKIETNKSLMIQRKTLLMKKVLFINMVIILFVFIIYSGSYSPTQLIDSHSISLQGNRFSQEIPLLNRKIVIPFRGLTNNLAIIFIRFRYGGDAYSTSHYNESPSQLVFKLFDEQNELLFESKQAAFNIEGEPNYPFGFPIISESENKNYQVELSLKGGSVQDQIFVDKSPASMITSYLTTRSELLKKPYLFFINRILFVLKNPNAVFDLIFILLSSGVYLILVKSRHNHDTNSNKVRPF